MPPSPMRAMCSEAWGRAVVLVGLMVVWLFWGWVYMIDINQRMWCSRSLYEDLGSGSGSVSCFPSKNIYMFTLVAPLTFLLVSLASRGTFA